MPTETGNETAPKKTPAKKAVTPIRTRVQATQTDRSVGGNAGGKLKSVAASGTGALTAGQKVRGIDGQVYYGAGTNPEEILANLTQFSYSIDGSEIDATDRATGQWGDTLTGRLKWSADISANLIQNGIDYTTFRNAIGGSQPLTFSFRPQDITAGFAETGTGVLSNVKFDSPENGMAKFTAKVSGRGPLVLGAIATGGS